MKEHGNPPHRITVSRQEAAAMLSLSVDAFDEHVRPRLPMIRVGRLLLISVRDLEQWVEENRVRIL
jgi:hypothetical protein